LASSGKARLPALSRFEIDFEIAGNRAMKTADSRHRCTPKGRPYAGKKFFLAERFGDVDGGTGIQRRNFVVCGRASTKQIIVPTLLTNKANVDEFRRSLTVCTESKERQPENLNGTLAILSHLQ
jgi:hypothetical protein